MEDPSPVFQAGAAAAAPSPSNRDIDWAAYIRKAGQGDCGALAKLYDESSSLVFGLAMRILGDTADAEEVTSDVYTQVWQHAATFDTRRGSPSAWLIMLTRSRAIDRIRSRDSRRRSETPMEGMELPAQNPAGESALYLTWQRDLVRRALIHLSPEQREVITLAFFSGFTQSELAEKLSLPLGTVKTRLRLALAKLRKALQETSAL